MRIVKAGKGLVGRFVTFIVISGIAAMLAFVRAAMQPRLNALPSFAWDVYWVTLKQYTGHLLHGTFGYLYQYPRPGAGAPPRVPTNASIDALIGKSLPETLILFGCALLLGLAAGLLLGMLGSQFSPRWVRGLATSANLAALSFPEVVLVVAVQFGIVALSRAVGSEVLPPFGTQLGELSWRHMVLPVLILSFFPAAYAGRYAVAAFDAVWQEDYIRTAHSKGVSRRRITWGHAMRNALIPLLGSMPVVTGLMISNLIMVEYLTNTLGLGRILAYELLGGRLQEGSVTIIPTPSPYLLASVLICFAALFMLVDGAADLILRRLDPRVRDTRQEPDAGERRSRGRLHWNVDWKALREALVHWRWSFHWRDLLNSYRGNGPLWLGTLLVAGLVLVAIFGPWLAPADPLKINLFNLKGGRNGFLPPFPPSAQYPLGSDALGRDLLSLVLYGTRYTLLIVSVIVPLRMLLAVPLGLAAGWVRGPWETAVRRMATVFGALPSLFVPALLIPILFPVQVRGQAFIPMPSRYLVLFVHALILTIIGVPRLAESIRLMTRELSTRPFVEGAEAAGAAPWRLMTRHILPHLKPQLAVTLAAEAAAVMLLMTQLAALEMWIGGAGFDPASPGLPVPNFPDWSTLLGRPQRYLAIKQWVLVVPGVAFFVAILAFNVLAEGMRRAANRLTVQAAVPSDAKLKAAG